MNLLISGLILWCGVHLIPSLVPAAKAKWQGVLGDNGYQGSFALLILLSLVMIIFGWRQITPEYLYTLPVIARSVAIFLILVSFMLMGASHRPTRIKSLIRHPQLTGLIVWAIAHLLVNGDNRSVILFGSLAIWGLVEIIAINRRDGDRQKPPVPAWSKELIGAGISVLVFVIVLLVHPYISGVSLR